MARPAAPAVPRGVCALLLAVARGACGALPAGLGLEPSTSADSLGLVQHMARARRGRGGNADAAAVTAAAAVAADTGGAAAGLDSRRPADLGRAIATVAAAVGAARSTASALPLPVPLYCAAFPSFCVPPFNCQNYTFAEQEEMREKGVALHGAPNVRSWCAQPQYSPMMSRCAAGDLAGAGRVQYDLTARGVFGGTTAEKDGSYCFLAGHCMNEAVARNTTAEEASRLCDERFGHETWVKYGSAASPPQDTIGYGEESIGDGRNGFTRPTQVRPYMIAACAMGNYHCDVVYCKETYCQNPYYAMKYGHLLRDFGWVE